MPEVTSEADILVWGVQHGVWEKVKRTDKTAVA